MWTIRNILYASTGMGDETEGLKQALSLARSNQAPVRVVVIYPELPKNLETYQEAFEGFLASQAETALQAARAALDLSESGVPVKVDVERSDGPPAIDLIRHVLRDGHDLLIKEAEPREGGKGFGSTDMTLVRKCPCPVWLARPITRSSKDIRVGVAISPESRDEEEAELATRLLQVSRSLADIGSGELDIISCSDYQFEEYLRRNTRVTVPEETILSAMQRVQTQHQASLGRLIQDSGIGGSYHLRYLRGSAGQAIPNFVEANAVDLLVMGTLARSGILGFSSAIPLRILWKNWVVRCWHSNRRALFRRSRPTEIPIIAGTSLHATVHAGRRRSIPGSARDAAGFRALDLQSLNPPRVVEPPVGRKHGK